MKIKNVRQLCGLLLLPAILFLACPGAEAQISRASSRITQAVDENNLAVLKGNVNPLARAEFDQGAVSDGQTLHRMLLLLQRGADQETALQQLLDDQQNKSSANYHAWLTPAQFGQQFGPSEADMQTVTNWLQSHGFQITNVTAGRTLIEFSGNAAQVRSAFHTEIHKYVVNGEARMANASDPQIPAALAPVVVGPVSLNNFPVKSHIRQLGTFQKSIKTGRTKPLFTFPGCEEGSCFGMGPADFAAIYNTAPLLSGTPKIDGTGQTIAIVGESNINVQDVIDFRNMFGLSQNFSSSNVILNGPDPGIDDSEGESDLDVQWSGAVAPGATIKFVTSAPTETTGGIFLSAIYIVENNLAGVMSESFGSCEQQIGTLNQFHNSLWEQAAAQGITIMVSSGDGGSAGCDNFDVQQPASHGLAVSGFASTPFNVAVGGTDFDQVNRWTQYWSSSNNSITQASALGYIPETPWNDSCGQLGITGCGASAPQGSVNIVAGSGGVSTLYPKPSWQSGTGVPLDSRRDLPDVSFFASNGFNGTFYIFCRSDASGTSSCNLNDFGFTFQGAGGTSVSTPAFAGIMALVNQKQATAQSPAPRQGNANYVLYQLFKKQTSITPALNCNSSSVPASGCTFNDVTHGNSALANSSVGNNDVPCVGGSTNCSIKTAGTNGVLVTTATPTAPAYSTTTGYDLATGLGSVNAVNLVNNWGSVTFLPSTTTLSATVNGSSVTSITGITHGTGVNLSSSVAAGQGASGTPSGQVALMATPNPTPGNLSANLGIEEIALTSGTATGTGVILPGGTYNLSAHYPGDGTFGSSDSTPGISVKITSESSKTLVSIPVFNPNTGAETSNSPTSLVYGSPYIARIDVGNSQAKLSFPAQPSCTAPACPTGTVTWTDSVNGAPATPLDGGTFSLNSDGYTEDQTIQLSAGMHALSAGYSGDNSYSASNSTYSLTVIAAPTAETIQPFTTNPVIAGIPFQIFVNGSTQAPSGLGPTGTVTFFDGATTLGSPVPVSGNPGGNGSSPNFRVVTPLTLANGGTHFLSAQYSGDANYASSTTTPLSLTALFPTTMTVTPSPTTITFGQSFTVTAVVTSNTKSPAMTGSFSSFGSFTPIPGTVTGIPGTDANGNQTLTATITTTPQSSEVVQVNYSGDSNFQTTSAATNLITVNIPDFALGPAGGINIVTSAGQSASGQFTITPVTQIPSTVTLGFQAPFTTIAGYTISLSSNQVSLNGSATTAMLSLTATGSSPATALVKQQHHNEILLFTRSDWWSLSAAIGLAAVFLLVFTDRRQRYYATMGLGWLSLLCFAVSCGGGGATGGGIPGGGAGGIGGATATSITLTTSSSKVDQNTVLMLTAQITAQHPLNGMVSLFDYGNQFIGTFAINGNQAIIGEPGNFFGLGVHQITAQYTGDSENLASTSTALSQVVTGTTSATIVGNTGSDSHSVQATLTLQ